MRELDTFTKSYIETALWCTPVNNYADNDDTSFEMANYDARDIAAESLTAIVRDCESFQRAHWDDISEDPSQAGHDFWLTRNRHGAGFWDGDYPESVGARLTEASQAYGECDLYLGDDGKIYVQ